MDALPWLGSLCLAYTLAELWAASRRVERLRRWRFHGEHDVTTGFTARDASTGRPITVRLHSAAD
ncbi:MAG: hypothetical protein HKP30_16355 [Myxococcales bacterium]|nr:hypothetical protein [Myxococcales bacterium]